MYVKSGQAQQRAVVCPIDLSLRTRNIVEITLGLGTESVAKNVILNCMDAVSHKVCPKAGRNFLKTKGKADAWRKS